MLSNIRNIASSFIIRLLLVIIAFSFVGWGVKDIFYFWNSHDLVTFKDIKNITEHDFLKAKSEELGILQKQSGINLSEEDLKELDFNRVVLQRLINDSILYYIANSYNLNLSEETVIDFVKQSPMFKNAQGEFDITILKSMCKNSSTIEQEYLAELKKQILRNTVITTFNQPFKTPSVMIQNIVDYMAEKRSLDLIQIDLTTPIKEITPACLTKEQVFEFYQQHKELFTKAETRSLTYLKVGASAVAKKIKIDKTELLNFYNENKQQFVDNFNKVKNQVLAALKQQKIAELMLEFAKNLEDDVAAGASLTEIAEKYELQLADMQDVSYNDLVSEESELSTAADAIFEMSEGEVLYPIELQDKRELLLVELSAITPARVLEFHETADKAGKLLAKRLLIKANLEIFENIHKSFATDNLSAANFKKLNTPGININRQCFITRAEIDKNNQLPQDLLTSIFQTEQLKVTPIFTANDTAYFAYIKKITVDASKAKNIKKNTGDSIALAIKNGITEELITHFIKKNKTKINFKNKVLQ